MTPALIALVLYALLPLVRGVVVGLNQIPIGRIVREQVQVGRVITFGGLLTDSQRILDAAESKEGRFIGINAPRSGAYDNGFQVVHMGYGVDEKVQVPQKLYEAGVPTVLVGKVADIVNNPYGVSWQNLVDSQRIMDITLNEFNTHPTAFICTNIQETDLAGHAEDVARYAERLQVVDRNLARLVEAMQPDDCLVVMADHGNDPTIGHSHHTREVVNAGRVSHCKAQTGDTGVNCFQVVSAANRSNIVGRQLIEAFFSVAVGFFLWRNLPLDHRGWL